MSTRHSGVPHGHHPLGTVNRRAPDAAPTSTAACARPSTRLPPAVRDVRFRTPLIRLKREGIFEVVGARRNRQYRVVDVPRLGAFVTGPQRELDRPTAARALQGIADVVVILQDVSGAR